MRVIGAVAVAVWNVASVFNVPVRPLQTGFGTVVEGSTNQKLKIESWKSGKAPNGETSF